MRVLTVGNRYPPASVGGYERIWAGTVEALRRAGHEVRVLTSDAPASDGDPDVFRELSWYWRDGAWARPQGVARDALAALRRHFASFEPDVVSWWGMGGLPLSLLAEPPREGIPAVGVVADGWMVYGFDADPDADASQIDLGSVARWLFISRAVEERARAEGHRLPRTGLAHPGVDPRRFPFSPPQPWGWRLACIGRVEDGKGVEIAVRALEHLPREATLTVDGPGDLDVHDPRVRRTCTPTDQIATAYAASDAVLFPVTWLEPWGLVPLEAMSSGRPVVATATGGSAEYLVHEDNCLVVPAGDAVALAAAVRRLADDATLRGQLVEGGRATAARFTQAGFEAAVVGALEAETRRR
ncbi:MAG: glycogen synthase [Solirubrobacteraceae bacterium]|nr:glycogen synthase [Solirubrobacteraceae bacterium]